jgi:hypothetical protein
MKRRPLLALVLLSALPARATAPDAAPRVKRVAPPEVPPVTIDGVRYEVLRGARKRVLPQNGGYVVAIDVASGRELWVYRIYEIRYNPALETDVQDRFIVSMRKTLFGGQLDIVDEDRRRFRLDPATRQVQAR